MLKIDPNHRHAEVDGGMQRILFIPALLALAMMTCVQSPPNEQPAAPPPHDSRWGIYSLNLNTQEVGFLYGSENEITNLRLNPAQDRIAFSEKVGGNSNEDCELFTLGVDGGDLQRLTDNEYLDTYPVWSPDGSQIVYVAWPGPTLDLYIMAADGTDPRLLYDSGGHDSDVDWRDDLIAFTRDSQIWIMGADGSHARQLTDPPRAGEWGNANLPFGDYDPRIGPDGSQVVFERLVDDRSPHGNYDLFTVSIDGTNLMRLTSSGYSQGLASWSPDGTSIAYVIAAIDDVGKFDISIISADGTDNRDVTPSSFPREFLVQWVTFADESLLYFIGEWLPEG